VSSGKQPHYLYVALTLLFYKLEDLPVNIFGTLGCGIERLLNPNQGQSLQLLRSCDCNLGTYATERSGSRIAHAPNA
jgi:hypothetical protein